VMRFAGVMPTHSRKIVEELMAEHAREAARAADSEEAAEAAKEAAARAFEAATSIDVASTNFGDPVRGYGKDAGMLGFNHFIQRSAHQVPVY